MPRTRKNDYVDPFAVGEIDPYARQRSVKPGGASDDEPMPDWEKDWDIDDDPYEDSGREREQDKNAGRPPKRK